MDVPSASRDWADGARRAPESATMITPLVRIALRMLVQDGVGARFAGLRANAFRLRLRPCGAFDETAPHVLLQLRRIWSNLDRHSHCDKSGAPVEIHCGGATDGNAQHHHAGSSLSCPSHRRVEHSLADTPPPRVWMNPHLIQRRHARVVRIDPDPAQPHRTPGILGHEWLLNRRRDARRQAGRPLLLGKTRLALERAAECIRRFTQSREAKLPVQLPFMRVKGAYDQHLVIL